MPPARFIFTIEQLDGMNREIQCKGEVSAEPGHVLGAVEDAMRQSFTMIHEGGYTVFGQPGKGACRGPYTITRVELRRMPS